FFEQVRRARDNLEPHLTAHLPHRLPIQLDDRLVVAPDHEQSGRLHPLQRQPRQVRATAPGDDRPYDVGMFGRRYQRGRGAGARAETPDGERLQILVMTHPACGGADALGESSDVEAELARASIDFLFLAREEIDEERRNAMLVE